MHSPRRLIRLSTLCFLSCLLACNEAAPDQQHSVALEADFSTARDRTFRRDGALDTSGTASLDRAVDPSGMNVLPPINLEFSVVGEEADLSLKDTTASVDQLALDSAVGTSVDHTQMVDENFEPSFGRLPNPERGFYTHIETVLGDGASAPVSPLLLNQIWLSGHRLVLFIVDLSRFQDTRLSVDALSALRSDFDEMRNAGLKCILRFRYTANATAPYGDATPTQVQAHLNQLTSTIRDHVDIILTIQAGFIGAWGEWFYTDNWGDLGMWSAQNTEDRRALVLQLLEILPRSRKVQLRTPAYRQRLFGSEQDCNSGSTLSRIGQHNDCFLASDTDFGTYQDPVVDYPWLHANTRCVPMGGETCAVGGDRSSCESALYELRQFHWTYLNSGYHPDVLAAWAEEGCLETIRNFIGYRLSLSRASYSVATVPGGILTLQLSGQNLGFAAPVNPREVAIVLTSQQDGSQWIGVLDADPREWLDTFSVQHDFGVPLDLPLGRYRVSLRLADPEPSLRNRVEFSIQLANSGFYDPETGVHPFLNLLNVREGIGSNYTGTSWLEQRLSD